mgnify:CR=1 FL=1
MLSENELAVITHTLRNAKNLISIFGVLPDGDTAEQKHALRTAFNRLAMLVHPDHNAPAQANAANMAFNMLHEFRKTAERAIDDHTYEQPFSDRATASTASNDSGNILQSPSESYILSADPFANGDFSVIYRAKTLSASHDVLIKIASCPQNNGFLENEARILADIHNAANDDPRTMTVSRPLPPVSSRISSAASTT